MSTSLLSVFSAESTKKTPDWQMIGPNETTEVPKQISMPVFQTEDWWENSNMDMNHNSIVDWLEDYEGDVKVGLSYDHTPSDYDIHILNQLGFNVNVELPIIDALLIGWVNSSKLEILANIDGVVMVEPYGRVVFFGDVQTPSAKSRSSAEYPMGAWDLGVSGQGINIAMVDTGVDNEHPGLNDKWVAGYDAVCYLHTDPTCVAAGLGSRESDGTYDPDDGNQHGTACMGMASANGNAVDGSQQEVFKGSAPDAGLVDVRIGTDLGAGPFENYFIEQEFYESAMNGIQWIIDNKDTAWIGVDEGNHGIDILSLSWGITSHEQGGSDGEDMHSRILDEATLAGIVVSVAAGNDGPNNDGLSGMGSSSLSITVGATDDQNTIFRDDDTIASYSSRGPRKDNGNNNPYDELKPEVTTSGTNIVQAEACVTDGGCNNFLGGDASQNGYTSRGSGTSYATPVVSGVVALMLEANPDLDPLLVRDILKNTAERKGDPTYPEIDPYWNKDFGWGSIDAYEAVKLSKYLSDENISGNEISLSLQTHVDTFTQNESNRKASIFGKAWAQQGTISSVKYSIDGSEWFEATYENEELISAGQAFNWSIHIDTSILGKGNHTLEIRSYSDENNLHSVPLVFSVIGYGDEITNAGAGGIFVVATIGTLLGIAAIMFVVFTQPKAVKFQKGNEGEEVFEAELLESNIDQQILEKVEDDNEFDKPVD